MIDLDSAATTQVKPEVICTMTQYMTEKWQNPSALYREAVTVRQDIENARQMIADYINAEPDEIIFTSGGSESNCTAIQGFVNKCRSESFHCAVFTSTIEHKSITLCMEEFLKNRVTYIDVDKNGFVDINMLDFMLDYQKSICPDSKILVSIQFANNEIGTIQHIKDISDVVHRYGGIFHTDAVQAFGHENIDVKAMGIDMLSASGHKIGAPKGVGILYKKKSINIQPIIFGTQEFGLRGGTENVPYIIGLAKAVEFVKADIKYFSRLVKFRDYFACRLKNELSCVVNGVDCTVNGSLNSIADRLSNNINVTFPQKITGEALIYMLNTSGILISAGSACNAKSKSVSHVLKAIGLTDDEALRTVRITLPDNITADDINTAMEEINKAVKILSM